MIRRNFLLALMALIGLASFIGLRVVDGPLDAAARRNVVANLNLALRDRYVFPDVGERAATQIAKAFGAGKYDNLTDRPAFAQALSTDVRAIAGDKHLEVLSPGSGLSGRGPRPPGAVARPKKLPSGIGYVEVVSFPPLNEFKPVLDGAMEALKGSGVLVIDVRQNGGGSPESVAYLVSYLVRGDRPLSAIISRVPKTWQFTRQTFSSVSTPVSFADIPVYVLTSKETFSGGEDFAYTTQALKRGIIVGEVTGGGANPASPVDLGHGLIAIIPFGRSENPITKTNWEGRGVQPDFTVPAKDALSHVLRKLRNRPAL
jgi:hypothetical protein